MVKLSFSITPPADCAIVPIFEEKNLEPAVKSLDKEYDGVIRSALETEDFAGKKMQLSLLYTKKMSTSRILLVGLGPKKDLTIRGYKQALGTAVIAAQSKKTKSISILIPEGAIIAFGAQRAAAQATVAAVTASYSFDEYKKRKESIR